nr:endonuclease domain-containing protein [uncultured Sphingomonas sp.]
MEDANRAREMRNNPTQTERRLWEALSARGVAGVRFNRQVRIKPYICDLVARTPRLIIEVDGGQHADSAEDVRRTRYLESKGYRVIRFWNNEVLRNLEGVVVEIERVLAALPSPSPSRKRKGSENGKRLISSHPFRLREGSGEGLNAKGERQP